MSEMEKVQDILEGVLTHLGIFDYKIYIRKSEIGRDLVFDVIGDNARELYRERDTLSALTSLLKLIADRKNINTDFSIDANGSRSRHIQSIQKVALAAAERVIASGQPFEFSPMTAFERKIVHSVLENKTEIKTESKGEGFDRRIIIQPFV